jgi:hypothetical protein
MSSEPRPDIYISADVETDGPIPGRYSMLSFGFSVAGVFDGRTFHRCDPRDKTFYRELQPISPLFQQEALDVNQLDRQRLTEEGGAPQLVMQEAAQWVESVAGPARAVLVAYPVAFDWAFLFWYFVEFADVSPFGYSSCLDIRTLFQARSKTVFDLSGKEDMPPWLRAHSPHTHDALDDAVEQAELFSNLFEWVLSAPEASAATAVVSDP